MNKIYEVNLMTTAAKTLYISAETAEDAGKIAETLYKNGAIDLETDTGIHIEAVSARNGEYYSERIDEENDEKNNYECALENGERCKGCELYAMFDGICPWS